MKKVAFISRDSNWQKYREDVMKKLAQAYDLEISILTAGRLKPYIHGNEKVKYYIFKSWLPERIKASFFPGALWKIMVDRPDAILSVANLSQITELFALFLSRLLGIRFVWWTHGFDRNPPRRLLVRKLRTLWLTFLLRWGNAVITFSYGGRNYLIQKGIPGEKIICAPNTLDTEKLLKDAAYARKAYSREEITKEFGLNNDSRFILFSGRLLSEKRCGDAIRALEIVKKTIPNVFFIVIGDGPDKENLEGMASEYIPGNYMFLGAVFDAQKLAKLFSISEIFVMPGYIGLAIVHAFCFGLPLITERVNHSPEIEYLHDGYNGFFVDAGDIECLAFRIGELLSDAQKLKKLSEAALNTVVQEASIQQQVHAMAKALGI